MDVRIGDAQLVTQAPYLALMSGSCTDRSAKKEELMYLRLPQGKKIDTQFFSLQRPPSLAQSAPKFCPLFLNFSASFCPCSNTKFGPQPGFIVHSPSPMTPSTAGSAWANPPKKPCLPVYISMYTHIFYTKHQTNHANVGKTPLGVTRPKQPITKLYITFFMSFAH